MFATVNDLPEFTATSARFGRAGRVEVEGHELDNEEAHALLDAEPHNAELQEAVRQADLVAWIVEA